LYIGSFILEFNFVIYNVTEYKFKFIISSNFDNFIIIFDKFLISSITKTQDPPFIIIKPETKIIISLSSSLLYSEISSEFIRSLIMNYACIPNVFHKNCGLCM
jgi:hypothetical protein